MVLVPVGNADSVGLRRAIVGTEVDRLFRILGDGKIDSQQNWKGRFKDNSEKMRTGSIYDVADVLKSLTLLSKSKNLSFREKRMLDRARFLVVSENHRGPARGPGDCRGARRPRAGSVAVDQDARGREGEDRQGAANRRPGRRPPRRACVVARRNRSAGRSSAEDDGPRAKSVRLADGNPRPGSQSVRAFRVSCLDDAARR